MTVEQLKMALRKSNERPTADTDEGFRVEEIRELTGASIPSIRGMIRKGLLDGSVTRSSRMLEQTNGRMTPVPSYVFHEKDSAC